MRAAVATLLAALLAPSPAAAQPETFLRINQTAGLAERNFAATYSLEAKRGLGEYQRGSGSQGSGGGGGLGGRKEYEGVNHRLALVYGVTDSFAIGVSQTLKQRAADDLSIGVLIPELRVNLSALGPLRRLPVALSSTFASHVRIDARRRSSAAVGLGVDKRLGRWQLASEVQFETTLAVRDRENGLRYEAGVSWAPLERLALSMEAWGTLVWPDYAVFQQDHHGGPSLRYCLGHFWAALGAGFGMQARPQKTFVDLGVMAKLGLRY